MFELIATIQTLSGMVNRPVSQSTDMEIILMMESIWQAQPATIMTRVELIEVSE